MPDKLNFSLIIPTYSGLATIQKTFASILSQKSNPRYQLIIVIDGPNRDLEVICREAAKKFTAVGIPVMLKQFTNNKGRFEARIEGAKLANSDQLLFVDDRVELGADYFEELAKINHKLAMPNVKEVEQKNRPISLTLRSIRKKIYGKNWGEEFADEFVDINNFEKSPKGTTSLWIDKEIFLSACHEVQNQRTGPSKFTNDDTKILKKVVEAGHKILRTSKLPIFYNPRNEFSSEIKHLFGRGTLFIDYYAKPGTRFFPLLVAYYLAIIALIGLTIFFPSAVVYLLVASVVGLILLTILIVGISSSFLLVLFGLVTITFVFGAGLLKGTWLALGRYGKDIRQQKRQQNKLII